MKNFFESQKKGYDLPSCDSSVYVNRRYSFKGNFDIDSNKNDFRIILPISDNEEFSSKMGNFDSMKIANDKALIPPTSNFNQETQPQDFESLEMQKPELKPISNFNGKIYYDSVNDMVKIKLN